MQNTAEKALGLVQVYTGNGKGKTTAALGLALRAAGSDLRIYIGQFLKARPCGELASIQHLSQQITLEQYGIGRWATKGNPNPDQLTAAQNGLLKLYQALNSGLYNIVIADEINVAVHLGLLAEDDLLTLAKDKPPAVELVITGRHAPQSILDRADLVTEMRQVRHPYCDGVPARKGIEF